MNHGLWSRSVGIVTDPTCAFIPGMYFQRKEVGTSYCYDGDKGYVRAYEDETDEKIGRAVDCWTEGDVITVRVDCRQWKVFFERNNKRLGGVRIEADRRYYPALECSAVRQQIFQVVD